MILLFYEADDIKNIALMQTKRPLMIEMDADFLQ